MQNHKYNINKYDWHKTINNIVTIHNIVAIHDDS